MSRLATLIENASLVLFGDGMNEFKGLLPAILIITGFLGLCGTVFKWDWRMNHWRTKRRVYFYGEKMTRFIYLVQSIIALVLGFSLLSAG